MTRETPIAMEDLYATEAANVQLVKDFLASWYVPHNTDISLLAPDGRFRTNDSSGQVHTPEGLLEYLRGAVGADDRIELVTHQIFAKGTLVVTSRTDIVKSPGKKDRIFEITSDFLVKNGKIAEWTDHVYSWRVEE